MQAGASSCGACRACAVPRALTLSMTRGRAHARGMGRAFDVRHAMPVTRARAGRPSPDEVPGAEGFLPEKHTLPMLRAAVPACRGCTLYRDATRAVFGEGSADARVMLVGEV